LRIRTMFAHHGQLACRPQGYQQGNHRECKRSTDHRLVAIAQDFRIPAGTG
jgi:hypothetical protein